MRKILFRGKVINDMVGCNGEFVYGYLTKEENSFYIEVPEMDVTVNAFEVNQETVGQFTGLTDRNGKEIYEGDIIRYENDIEHGNGTIEFNCGFNIIWDLNTVKTNNRVIQSPLFYFQCSSELQIIGNIHDKTKDNAKS